MSIVNYTEKSIAVFGVDSNCETLRALGGKFNSNLRGKPGWIFPNINESAVRGALSDIKPQRMKEVEEEDVVRPVKRLLQRPAVEPKDDVVSRLERIEKLLIQLVNR